MRDVEFDVVIYCSCVSSYNAWAVVSNWEMR